MNAATLAIILISQVGIGADRPKVPTTYTVRISVREKPATGQGRILADPMIGVVAGRVARFQVGEHIHFGGADIPSGTTAEFRIDPIRDSEVKITGKVEIAVANAPDREVVTCESTSIHLAKTLTCGKNTRIQISKNNGVDRWIEIQVDKANEPAQAIRTAGSFDAPPFNVGDFDNNSVRLSR